MVREDLVAGLRNALERGASLESAKQSLVNAGYSNEEVEEASNYLHAGSVLAAQPQQLSRPADSVQPSRMKQPVLQANKQPSPQQIPKSLQEGSSQVQKPKGHGFFARNWKIIVLLTVLVILIVLFVLVILFKDTIAGWF